MSTVKQIKEIFKNWREIIKIALISLVPILNFTASGYVIKVARNKMKKRKLPKFEISSDTFVDGFFVFVIGFIYGIIVNFIVTPLKYSYELSPSLEGLTVCIILYALIYFVANIFIFGAILRFAEKKKLSEAFNFGKIANKVFSSNFIVEYIKNVIISILIGLPALVVVVPIILFITKSISFASLISSLIGLILPAMFFIVASNIYLYAAMAQVYRKIR